MARADLRLITTPEVHTPRARAPHRHIGDILVETGALAPADLLTALALQKRQDLRLGDILIAHDMVTEEQLLAGLAIQYAALPIDMESTPPDPRLMDELGLSECLKRGILPVQRMGGATIVATCHPAEFHQVSHTFPRAWGDPILALASERALHKAILDMRDTRFAQEAETCVPEQESCRFWYGATPRRVIMTALMALCYGAVLAPVATLAALTFWAIFTLLAATALKAAATWAVLRTRPTPDASAATPLHPRTLPMISVLVPLLREEDILERLIARLGRLTYPKELLDVCLIVEDDDHQTCAMLENARLPQWMRVITVPEGQLKTKPRALNYALKFCRGSIVGIYDAEDAPAPDQLHEIAKRFAAAPTDVACLQGVLDFYNTGNNWFSRCFTVEYATWFRMVLPGIAKLGLVVPLGGTTLFFRRDILEQLGGWDAHNVTEDADLGVRLARHGYRTELVRTVTEEEANCHIWPWIKQRSRWLKGYAMTWSTHMRDPKTLWHQLGPRRFWGYQVLFLGTLSQFLLVPVLWSLWVIPLGLTHPLQTLLSAPVMAALGALFVVAELLNITVGILASRRAGKGFLLPWVPTLHFYYPLAALATYKAVFEMVARPFYWDKTYHGITQDDAALTAETSGSLAAT